MVFSEIQAEKTPHATPLLRLSVFGQTAEEPLITQAVQRFSVSINILQAHIESIRHQTLGVMLVEIQGDENNIIHALDLLRSKGVHIEVMGYVT